MRRITRANTAFTMKKSTPMIPMARGCFKVSASIFVMALVETYRQIENSSEEKEEYNVEQVD
jgi:hypothetical protein